MSEAISEAPYPASLRSPDDDARERLAETLKLPAGQRVRYIKLGNGGAWEDECLRDGTIRIGFASGQHAESLRGDWDALLSHWQSAHNGAGAGARAANQIRDFYELPDATLWFTVAHQDLWWCHAKGPPEELEDKSRIRRAINGWFNTDLLGQRLTIEALDGRLTTTANFRGTVCRVKHEDYAVRRIIGEQLSEVAEARENLSALVSSVQALVVGLHWADFEILTDLLFVRSGWQRMSVLGKTGKSKDLDLMAPLTNRRAFVQVKSTADLHDLRRAIDDCTKARSYQDLFFVYHSPDCDLNSRVPTGLPFTVTVLDAKRIAELTVRSGLVDWLIEKRS